MPLPSDLLRRALAPGADPGAIAELGRELDFLHGQAAGLARAVDDVGLWTPGFSGSTTVGSYTYTAQLGQFVRWRNLMLAFFNVGISAIGVAPTGAPLLITGLPAPGAVLNQSFVGSLIVGYHNLTLSANKYQIGGIISWGETSIRLYELPGAVVPVANLPATGQIIGCAVYQTSTSRT